MTGKEFIFNNPDNRCPLLEDYDEQEEQIEAEVLWRRP